MIVNLKVIPNSSRSELVEDEYGIVVQLRAAPADGKANKELIEILASYYNTHKSSIKIISGHTKRNKIIKVDK